MDPMLESFDNRFAEVRRRSVALLRMLSDTDLFRKPRELDRSMAMFSCGEYLLRSTAAIEQTCGGITTRLWDDPFEWTLPETLSNADRVVEYLDEVDLARQRTFDSIDDAALSKYIAVPSGESRQLISVLLKTLVKASEYRGRAMLLSSAT